MFFIRLIGQDGLMATRVEAEEDLGAWRTLQAKALVADGNSAIGADLQRGSEAPNIRPPRAARGWADDGTHFFFGQVPGALGGQIDFSVSLMRVAMES